jgi:outer membrane protein assembly factor BamB
MCATFTRPAMKLFLALAVACSTLSSAAYTYVQAGVESNFLIEGYRVLFAQSDGSLTALSLESGSVLMRNKTRDFSGTLLRIPQGVLLFTGQSAALLDPTSFSTVWETQDCLDPSVTADALVTHDGRGEVYCRSLADGSLRWTYELSAVSTLVAESGKVLLHRDATYDKTKLPMVVLLDLENGKPLLRRVATNRVHWARAFFDGTNIFIASGPFMTNRFDYKPEKLLVWNTQGEEIASLSIPIALQRHVRDGNLFELDFKVFWGGRVYPNRQSIPPERQPKPVAVTAPTNSLSRTIETEHDLGNGDVLVERALYSGTNGNSAFAMQIELRSPVGRWTGVLPYLLDRGRIAAVGKAEGRIVIGTDLGHVECISADTGESKWLYVFPTLHRTVSSSPHDPPPMMAEAAAIFDRENSRRPTSGLQIVGARAAVTRIIYDPEPIVPYRNVSAYLAAAWCGGAFPLAILILLHIAPGTRRWEPSSLGSIAVWLTFIAFGCYVYFGQVSEASSLTLKTTLTTGFIAGAWNVVQCFRRRQWIEATILMVIFGAVALFMAQALS